MATLRIILLVLHVAAAAVLVGASAGLIRNLKRNLELGGQSFVLATEDLKKRSGLMGMCSLTTLATGLCLIFMMGGFAVAPKNFHIALLLLLVALIFSATFMRPRGVKLGALAKKEPLDKEGAMALIKKLAMGQGILHLLWLCTLTLMFVRMY
jgi:high-affinity Fe2+/Pb2+ permease